MPAIFPYLVAIAAIALSAGSALTLIYFISHLDTRA